VPFLDPSLDLIDRWERKGFAAIECLYGFSQDWYYWKRADMVTATTVANDIVSHQLWPLQNSKGHTKYSFIACTHVHGIGRVIKLEKVSLWLPNAICYIAFALYTNKDFAIDISLFYPKSMQSWWGSTFYFVVIVVVVVVSVQTAVPRP
jgi:hypothetical protein